MDSRLHHEGWTRHDAVVVRGQAFDGMEQLSGEALAERFGAVAYGEGETTIAEITAVADSLAGFYAAVVDPPGEHTFLVADGARSIPLYYDTEGQVLSDDGKQVARAVDASRDPITESAFLLTRYVTGPDTVWRGVHSTQAGEVVCLGDEPTRRTYREYWPAGGGVDDPTAVLDTALETAIDRLLAVAGDRRVVLPLSGGYDSRLLASALTDRGHPVTGFTFGRPGHPDVEVSREVADRLGIDWELVEYDQAGWAAWYHGQSGREFRADAFNGDALPFVAAQLAVRRLLEEGRVPTDAVWCPGHTVTTPGERLPLFGDETARRDRGPADCGAAVHADETPDRERIEPTVQALVVHVLENQYTLWEWENTAAERALCERIERGLLGDRDPSAVRDRERAAAAYERWEWRGRQTTFTTGDIRGYEAAGVDWWLPLWDPAYVAAWERLAVADRRGKRAHAALTVDRYRDVADVSAERAGVTDRTLDPVDRLLARVRHTPARALEREWEPPFLAPRSSWRSPGRHPLAWYGIVDPAVRERVPEDRSLYAFRTLAQSRDIDLSNAEATVPETSTIELPAASNADRP